YPGSGGREPDQLTAVNGTLFFVADDPTNAFELWKSDGTAAGTVLVKDINHGAGGDRGQGGVTYDTAPFTVRGRQTAGDSERRDGGGSGAREGHQRQRRLLPGSADGRERDALLRRLRSADRPRALEERRDGGGDGAREGHQLRGRGRPRPRLRQL